MKDLKGLWGLSSGKSFTRLGHCPAFAPAPKAQFRRETGSRGREAGRLCHPFTASTGPRQPSSGTFSPGGPESVLGNQVISPQGWRPFIQTVSGCRGGGRAAEVLEARMGRCGALAQRHQHFLGLDCGQEVISNLSLPSRKA